MSLIEFKKVSRVYKVGDHEQKALSDVDLDIPEGKFIVILGPSGAGKSTLLNLLGGLDSPTSGTICVQGKDISKLSNDELADYRAETVGFVFQSYNLIPTLTVFENVSLVKEITSNPLSVNEMLNEVGLSDHKDKFPSELSGGEQQRVSIAKLLVKSPDIILADEPTGSLDAENRKIVMSLLSDFNKDGKTILIVTHDEEVKKCAKRYVAL
jgi:putative ABC transport system ATP-binding protein